MAGRVKLEICPVEAAGFVIVLKHGKHGKRKTIKWFVP